MKYNLLGSSKIKVSEISMGCMSLNAQDSSATIVISQALDQGINFFDTADLYEQGKNEELLGMALSGKRKEVIIATKVGNQWTPGKEGWQWNPTKEYILTAIEDSLRRLRTDYIDLYQLHGGTIDDPIDEIIEAFELLKSQGKIRAYGISSIRPNVIREFASRSNIASVMMQYNILDRRPEESCFEILTKQNISVITRGTLAKGLLTGKQPLSYLNLSEPNVSMAAKAVADLAKKYHTTPSNICCQFALAHNPISSAVIGIRTNDQLVDLHLNKEVTSLLQSDLDALSRLAHVANYTSHL